MFNHVSLGTNNIDRARRFYDPLMSLLGFRLIKQTDRMVGYGTSEVTFSLEGPFDEGPASAGNGAHVAFQAGTRGMVDAFHAAGLAHGGTDAGEPGLRTAYDANYYAAFLLDPDGNKIEAVTYAAK